MQNFDFKLILDDGEDSTINTRGKVLKSVGKHAQGKSVFFSKVPVKPILPVLAYRMNEQLGIYEGEYIRKWMDEFIQNQVNTLTDGKHNGEHLTFEELHQLTLDYPGVFRDLSLIGSNYTTGKKMLFCYNHDDTKDVIIADAIRISMSIPMLFKPHHIYFKENNERLVDAKRELWVDGGAYDNYPIDCFDAPEYTEMGKLTLTEDGKRLYNPETLGFRLVSREDKDYFEGMGEELKKVINNFMTYVTELIQLGGDVQEERYAYPENIKRTVYIDHKDINTLEFNLSDDQKKELILSGQEATKDYLLKNASNVFAETNTI